MTEAERELVLSLVTTPRSGPTLSKEEFLHRFGTADGKGLGLELLRDAVARQDGVDAALSLVVCAVFGGTTVEHLEPLIALATADWHVKHEDVVTHLGRLRSPEAVDALYTATEWVPDYLDFDEDRTLAVKAIRALRDVS